jgi:hypothetical protein
LQRRADGGLLWGAIGLHGGLVGGWFALQAGLLELLPQAPSWLAGPGGAGRGPPESDWWAGGLDRFGRVGAAAATLVEWPKGNGASRAAFPGRSELGASWCKPALATNNNRQGIKAEGFQSERRSNGGGATQKKNMARCIRYAPGQLLRAKIRVKPIRQRMVNQPPQT